MATRGYSPSRSNLMSSSRRLSSSSLGRRGRRSSRSSSDKPKNPVRYKQQRLLLLQHSEKCTRIGECPDTPHCAYMKRLWAHIGGCRMEKTCRYPHCPSSKKVLRHYRNCKDNKCPVCVPVRARINKVAKRREAAAAAAAAAAEAELTQNNDPNQQEEEEEEDQKPVSTVGDERIDSDTNYYLDSENNGSDLNRNAEESELGSSSVAKKPQDADDSVAPFCVEVSEEERQGSGFPAPFRMPSPPTFPDMSSVPPPRAIPPVASLPPVEMDRAVLESIILQAREPPSWDPPELACIPCASSPVQPTDPIPEPGVAARLDGMEE